MDKKEKIGASYNRVSDDESADKDSGSLNNQEHIARETAEILTRTTGTPHKIEYFLTEKRGQSGGNTNRPQYQVLWKLITLKKIDFLVAKEISRLNRSIKDFCELTDHCRKNNVAVHIKGLDIDFNTPMGELIFKLLALIAEFERTLIIERTRSGIRAGQLNESKIHGGRLLLGFDTHPEKPGVWVPNKVELNLVDRLLEAILEQDSVKSVCKILTKEGIQNKYGGEFRSDSLKRLVTSRRYEGILEINDNGKTIERTLDFGPVLDLKKLKQARDKLKQFENNFSTKTRLKNRTYLLTGLLKHVDGSPFRGDSGTGKQGERHYYYFNPKHKLRIDANELEEAILNALSCYKNDKEIQGFVLEIMGRIKTRCDCIDDQIRILTGRLSQLKSKEAKILDTLLSMSSNTTAKWLDEKLKEMADEKEGLGSMILRLRRDKESLSKNQPHAKNMAKTIEYVYTNFRKAEPSVQRNFFRQLFNSIELLEKNKIKLHWKFTECDSGGEEFVLGTAWGG